MEELRRCSVDVSRCMLMGESGRERADQLRARIESLRAERARLLTAGGYSPQALDTIYTCSKCRDTGLLEDGTRCSCYQDKLRLLAKQEGRA
jgi:DNA replication protein DnaC